MYIYAYDSTKLWKIEEFYVFLSVMKALVFNLQTTLLKYLHFLSDKKREEHSLKTDNNSHSIFFIFASDDHKKVILSFIVFTFFLPNIALKCN